MRAKIVARMDGGATFDDACQAVGIHPATGRRWMQRDKDFAIGVKLPRLMRRFKRLSEGKPMRWRRT